MTRRARAIVNMVLTLVIVAGVLALVRQRLGWREGELAQDKAIRTVQFTPSPEAPVAPDAPPESAPEQVPVTGAVDPVIKELLELDLEALRSVNPEVIGWIYIPGTAISYPLLQGPDNDYYLKHTWERKWNAGGSIFLDSRCSLEASHAVIYGHRMLNGSMFAPLKDYADPDFLAEHGSIYVADGETVRRYAVFAAWEAGVDSPVYAPAPETEAERGAFAALCAKASAVDTGLTPGAEDQILTLSTCTGQGHATRWVVQAYKAGPAPAEPEPTPEPTPADPAPAPADPAPDAPIEAPDTPPETPTDTDSAPEEEPIDWGLSPNDMPRQPGT